MTPRADWAPWIFPGILCLSLAAHGAVLATGRWPGTGGEKTPERPAELLAVVLLEPAPPEVVPDPPPASEPVVETPPPADPTPLPEPVLSQPAPVPEVPPAPTPAPSPKVRPKPAPKPLPATTATAPRPVARTLVKARPDTAHNPPPRYPEMARRNGWEGRVMVRAHVSAAGRVTAVSLHQGCAYGVLNQAALAAVRTWRFRPGTIGGQAADSVVEVPVNFSLRR